MSTSTMIANNQNQLYGFTEKRGKAYMFSEKHQGNESNHYDGAIPIADISRRLFNFQAISRKVAVELPATIETMTHLDENNLPVRWTVQTDRQAIVRDDTFNVMGLFKTGYTPHQYEQWLIQVLSNIVGDTLGFAAVGVLREGALAYAQIEAPDNIMTPEGVEFRSSILTGTSFDGSVATFYKPVNTILRCDNQFESLRRSKLTAVYKVKHSRNSEVKIADARAALGMIVAETDEFSAEIKALCETTVTDKQFSAFLESLAPTTENNVAKTGRGLTMATNKQDTLRRLWVRDDRVSPWKNTAFGVVQAVNTYSHHEQTVKGTGRAERNVINTIKGTTAKADVEALDLLQLILSNA